MKQLDHRRRLIDSFINAIYLFDDYLVITFNYKEGTKTITFAEIEEAFGSDLSSLTAGMMKRFMVATFTDLVLRVALAEICSRTALGTTGIWLSWPIGWTIAAILSIVFYATVKWQQKSQKAENPSCVKQ